MQLTRYTVAVAVVVAETAQLLLLLPLLVRSRLCLTLPWHGNVITRTLPPKAAMLGLSLRIISWATQPSVRIFPIHYCHCTHSHTPCDPFSYCCYA